MDIDLLLLCLLIPVGGRPDGEKGESIVCCTAVLEQLSQVTAGMGNLLARMFGEAVGPGDKQPPFPVSELITLYVFAIIETVPGSYWLE